MLYLLRASIPLSETFKTLQGSFSAQFGPFDVSANVNVYYQTFPDISSKDRYIYDYSDEYNIYYPGGNTTRNQFRGGKFYFISN